MRRIALGVYILLLLAPGIALAQTTNASGQAASTCDLPVHTLRRGSSGSDVSHLQQFLARNSVIYPEAIVSGYFGALTELAVERWQTKFNIVTSGTPDTTGYGRVGPRTLAAMRTQWCLQAQIAPAPFTPPPVSVTPPPAPPPPPAVHIMFTTPAASTTVNKGNNLFVSWLSDTAQPGASVTLSLQNESGQSLGIVKNNLSASGSYYWTVPVPPSPITGTCTSDPITCISQVAQTQQTNCDPFCSLDNGAYKLYGQVFLGGSEVAHAESRVFSVGGVGLSSSDVADTGTVWNFTAPPSGTSLYATTTVINPNPPPQPASSTAPLMCMYSGIPYSEGITVEINCADVTVPGQGCGVYGGMQLTCKSGQWVDQYGLAQSVRNVTTTGGAGSCTTPWNATLVTNGDEVPREPFFTNGVYHQGSGATLIMKCSGGSWQTCDTVGANCS